MKIILWILEQLKSFKVHIVIMFFSTLVFLILLFPYNDLSDLITTQISKLTQNTVLIQFQSLNLNFIPTPGIELNGVYAQTPATPSPISTDSLVIRPSINGLISQKPYGTIKADGFMKGDVKINVSKGSRTENGNERYQLEIEADKINLSELKSLIELPLVLNGQLNLELDAQADLTLQEQPDMDFKLSVNNLDIPPATIELAQVPLTLPDLKLSKVTIQGRLSAGKLILESAQIGDSKDELNGTIKGNLGLNLRQRGRIYPEFGAYQFEMNLNSKKSFQNKAGLFFTFIDKYKTENPSGAQFKFKISGSNFYQPPTLSAMQ